MARKPIRKAEFGSISSGTMRERDLIPEFVSTLDYLGGCNKAERALIREANKLTDEDYELENAGGILEDLFDALDRRAPAYGYFGAHPGDGADYGFWLCEEFPDHCFDGLRVSDTSEVPRDYTGEVLHVNDHGNMTLYAARRGKLREVWSLV